MTEKNKHTIFRGAATALITPMNSDGSIDYMSFGRLIDCQIDSGIDALVVLGTTGEASTLSESEKKQCIEFAINKINNRVPAIIGTGSNYTDQSVAISRFAENAGADALLVVTPYYNKTSQMGLTQHFLKIADSVSIPIIVYNVPQRTGMTISLPVYREIAKHPNISAVKEASGNISYVANIAAELSDSLDIYSGCDDCTIPILSLGGLGVISVLSNIIPGEIHELCSKFFSGNIDEAKNIQLRQIELNNAIFSDVNPIPIKSACEMLGYCTRTLRLPLFDMSEESRLNLKNVLIKYGLLQK